MLLGTDGLSGIASSYDSLARPCGSYTVGAKKVPRIGFPVEQPPEILSFEQVLTRGRLLQGCAMTIGNFDGVHLGHQRILERLSESAQVDNRPTVAMTFEPHPVLYFRPQEAPFLLSTPAQKARLLTHYGIAHPTVVRFDQDFHQLAPEDFIRETILNTYRPKLLVVGYDFNFGRGRRGSPDLVRALCEGSGLEVVVQEAVATEGVTVSSTAVRKAVRSGDIAHARQLLGRPYGLVGPVITGAGRGSKIGFPTANLAVGDQILPPPGVLFSYLEVAGRLRPAVTNVGVRPTFGESEIVVETFVLDSDDMDDLDLYGAHVAVHFLARLRDERKFDSADALVAQIGHDIAQCRALMEADRGEDIVRFTDPA